MRAAFSQEKRQAFDIHAYGQSVLSRVASVLTPAQRARANAAVKGAEAKVNGVNLCGDSLVLYFVSHCCLLHACGGVISNLSVVYFPLASLGWCSIIRAVGQQQWRPDCPNDTSVFMCNPSKVSKG